MRRFWLKMVAATAIAFPAAAANPANPANGERLAYTMGCVSCHNRDMTGHLVEEDPERLVAWSTNLSRRLPGWRDADIARALRTGKRPDGSDIWVMPVHSFHWINDAEMRDLTAFLRSVPPTGVDHPPAVFGPRARAAIASGKAKPPAGFLAEDLARAPRPLPGHGEGRRLALLICGDCHGADLKGYEGEGAPANLLVASAYTLPDFARLLRNGTRADGSASGMTEYSRDRLFKLTDAEIRRIWNYLRANAARGTKLPQ
ncbi:c-type cytochrome [Polymorphobacter fuscus]|nr:c-type cytochrome [Polymorphobacter fuscus]NJC07226.1 mono/diheme cytochrome c family protein [Polymorphobacter fuscus]